MSNYFQKVPNFEYVSRLPNAKISDYIVVKNLFKRGKLREDIFQNLAFFEKYKITGDERPDNVAYDYYGDSRYDWVVLLSNNILNIQSEWPLTQTDFDSYLLEKYGTYEKIYDVHHYETTEVTNSQGVVVVPAGLQVPSDYSITYYDQNSMYTKYPISEVSNYDYEFKLDNDKRNIFLLKQQYLNVIVSDLDEILPYKEGTAQYVSSTLVKGDNIRIYN